MAQENFPRDLAVRILTRVLSDQQPLDEAVADLVSEFPKALQGGSRAWLQEVCSGTLRWKGRLDLVIDSIALKKKPSGWLRKILLIATYQLIAQDRSPAGLVVSETVSAIKKKEGEAPARFANALLRKVADHASEWRDLKPSSSATLEEVAHWASIPPWLWQKLIEDHGREWAEIYAMASLDRPTLWIRALKKPEWAESGPVEGAFRGVEGGPVFDKAGFSEGEFFVQDISSQILVREISQTVEDAILAEGRPEGKISAFDLCASPGGKTVGLLWSGVKSGMDIYASDRDEKRLALLRQTVARVGKGVKVIAPTEVDALPLQDLVWVDAPCSGSGILRRHPDVRWLRREKDLEGLLKTQQELITRGWSKVRPGGYFAYSVCSVLKAEGPIAIEKARLPSKSKEWFLLPQTTPNGDGFWACLIRKPNAN